PPPLDDLADCLDLELTRVLSAGRSHGILALQSLTAPWVGVHFFGARSNQSVIGSWPRPSDAGDLQRDASDQRTRVAGVGKRVSGTVVDASGASVRARVVVEVGSSGASVEGSTDANGHFAVFLEGAAGIIRVVCTAAPALRGEHSTALAIDDTTQDVGVIVVRHLVTLTLRLLAKSGAVSRLGMDPTERVEVVLRKAGQGFAATLAQEAVGELDRNVDPASTMQVANALLAADKDFELVVVPSGGHGVVESPALARRRQDFFVRHLHGVEPRGR
ncbi:MAG: prolyl oligopeptidase family serine peptidase, partial [Planctomycetota bacterium]